MPRSHRKTSTTSSARQAEFFPPSWLLRDKSRQCSNFELAFVLFANLDSCKPKILDFKFLKVLNKNISFIVVRGASKIKLKKVNKKRTVTVRRVIIFLNISRHPLLICLQCCLHQYKL